jgi:ribonuclease P protein component
MGKIGQPVRRATFPRSARLLRHADFERVYKQGKRHFATHMTLFYLPRTEGEGFRTGFTVGRVLGGAVERNRIKRRLREAVRLRRPVASAAIDIVINPKKSLLTVEFSELLLQMERALNVIQQKCEKP